MGINCGYAGKIYNKFRYSTNNKNKHLHTDDYTTSVNCEYKYVHSRLNRMGLDAKPLNNGGGV